MNLAGACPALSEPARIQRFIEGVDAGETPLTANEAARQLNLTQPAVSLHIRELEQRLGVSLIERMGRRAYATAPGLELLEHANRIFQECDAVTTKMRRYREGWIGRVHIGTTLTALTYELPPILRKLRIELEPWRDSGPVRSLDERLALAG